VIKMRRCINVKRKAAKNETIIIIIIIIIIATRNYYFYMFILCKSFICAFFEFRLMLRDKIMF